MSYRTTAVWSDELSDGERALLDPGPDSLPRRPDVLVVGGGALGVATAVFCLRAELGSVLLVERSSLASGATGGAAGLLTPEAHHGVDPDHFVALAREGLDLWRGLQADVPGGVGLLEMDWISLEPHDPGFAADLPPGSEQLTADEVAALLPSLTRPVPAVRLHQARVNPVLAVARLVGSAPRLAVATGVGVEGATVERGRVTSVSTSAGPVSPGIVVFATGQAPRLSGLDLDVPSGVVKGHLLLTEPAPAPWPASVAPLATVLSGNRLLIGGSLDVDDTTPDVRQESVDGLRAWLEAFVSPESVPATSRAWCCFRPTHPDLMPVIDRVPGLDNAWLTSGHYRTGIVMAPAVGRAIAAWVSTGEQPAGTAPYRADRFTP